MNLGHFQRGVEKYVGRKRKDRENQHFSGINNSEERVCSPRLSWSKSQRWGSVQDPLLAILRAGGNVFPSSLRPILFRVVTSGGGGRQRRTGGRMSPPALFLSIDKIFISCIIEKQYSTRFNESGSKLAPGGNFGP